MTLLALRPFNIFKMSSNVFGFVISLKGNRQAPSNGLKSSLSTLITSPLGLFASLFKKIVYGV